MNQLVQDKDQQGLFPEEASGWLGRPRKQGKEGGNPVLSYMPSTLHADQAAANHRASWDSRIGVPSSL